MKRILFAFATIAVVVIGGAPTASARDCTWTETSTDATLNRDGSMDVVEHVTYEFDSGCHGGIREIGLHRTAVDDDLGASEYVLGPLSVTEDGRSVPIAEQRPGYIRWGSASETVSGHHEYDISYRVENAVFVAPDVAVLFWDFVGDEFPKQDRVDVTIHTPGDGGGLRIFVHGILEGTSELRGSDAVLSVEDNPAGRPIAVRLLEPPFDYDITPSGEPLEDQILAREKVYAEESNAEREQLKQDLADKARDKRIGNVIAPILGVGGFIGFMAIFRKWGKEPEKPMDVGDYYREVPEESPAVIQAFLRWGDVPQTAFSSTVIDLAQRGYLTISEEVHEKIGKDRTEYTFTSTGKAHEDTTDYENKLLKRIFAGGRTTVTMDEITDEAKDDRTESSSWFSSFKSMVRTDLSQRHYFREKGRLRPYCLHFVVIGALILTGVATIGGLGSPLGIVPLVIGGVLFLLTGLLRQRTPEGARKLAEIEGLRRFLKDFSRVDELPVGGLALYERYLVYGVALGVAKELMEGMKLRVPEIAAQPDGFATWYVGSSLANGGTDRISGLADMGAFANNFSSATAAAFSPPSSSSGSGGGFSGGGSSGGGGGGGGGW